MDASLVDWRRAIDALGQLMLADLSGVMPCCRPINDKLFCENNLQPIGRLRCGPEAIHSADKFFSNKELMAVAGCHLTIAS